ncbi:hypothetical protein [Rhodococcus chondri]|uniref:Uncharacterized protein n=1 Tax=Rhodococcus chondri TaxID=3065941 RepID=A0ABU7JLL3_9NOCA|nr:hypothetical protein [Rhodococcus sp. CC-R104]MEE2030930.1 hypothetical protein [Rhodococcus sp. CC-R104]
MTPFAIDEAHYFANNSYQLLEQLVAHRGMPTEPDSIERLSSIGAIGPDRDLRTPESDISGARVAAVIRSTLQSGYGYEVADFEDFFRLGYGQVAPTVALPQWTR